MHLLRLLSILLLLGLLSSPQASAQSKEEIPFMKLGKIKPRNAHEIFASNWAIGGETLDRGYTDFEQWKSYLGPLGAKKIRLQSGWAKCEPEKGVYDFQWLDEIIDGVIDEGVEPWLQTSYGNPIYEGGGDIFLSAGFPESEEALVAWDHWVSAMAQRYQGRVKTWEIWNESDLNAENSPDEYAKLFIRTAEIIRAHIPDAEVYALSLAHIYEIEYIEGFLAYLKVRNKLHLVDAITLHGYTFRPEQNYAQYFKIQRLIQAYASHIGIVQGELGCPSEYQTNYALKDYAWTEASQTKWLLRRLLGDLGHDIPSLYFSMIDMNYVRRYENNKGKVTLLDKPIYTANTKGLLKANKDNTVAYKKPSYYAYQCLTALFDNSLTRIKTYPYTVDSDSSLRVYAYQSLGFDYQMVSIWMDGAIPRDSHEKTLMEFTFPAGNFSEPVYVDMRTGTIYEIPASQWHNKGTSYTFKDIPVYDAPILIADRKLLRSE